MLKVTKLVSSSLTLVARHHLPTTSNLTFGLTPTGGAHLQWDPNNKHVCEFSLEVIQEVIEAFGAAVARAARAGIDTIEIHGAHGFLIHSFLSPLTNHRTDQYGGSLENRARFLLQVIRAARANFPADKPIFLRTPASEHVEDVIDAPSWEIERTIQISQWAKEAGVDVLDDSSGGTTPQQKIVPAPNSQVPLAERVKKAVPRLSDRSRSHH